jgi:hypothetical protein
VTTSTGRGGGSVGACGLGRHSPGEGRGEHRSEEDEGEERREEGGGPHLVSF